MCVHIYERIYVFRVIIIINICYLPTQYSIVFLRNVQELFSLCSRNLILDVIRMNVSLQIVHGCRNTTFTGTNISKYFFHFNVSFY